MSSNKLMHYFIDGYNLLFRAFYSEDLLHTQRQKIIEDINKKLELVGLDVTIVFDATYQVGESTRSHFRQVEVIYTAGGETADEYIIQALKESPSPSLETVVTSDKQLAWRARRRSAHTQSVEEFLNELNHRYQNKKQQAKSKKVTPKEPLPKPPKKKEIPQASASLSECFAYYLEVFEKQAEKLLQEEELKPKKSRKGKKKSDNMSDMERWLKIFEERSAQDG